ncbi:unnamed protein product, partial [Polarella glacialis]
PWRLAAPSKVAMPGRLVSSASLAQLVQDPAPVSLCGVVLFDGDIWAHAPKGSGGSDSGKDLAAWVALQRALRDAFGHELGLVLLSAPQGDDVRPAARRPRGAKAQPVVLSALFFEVQLLPQGSMAAAESLAMRFCSCFHASPQGSTSPDLREELCQGSAGSVPLCVG